MFESNVSNEQLRRLEAPQLELVEAPETTAGGRVWDATPERKTVRPRGERMAQSREYEGVLTKLLRRIAR
ncbi:MAG: hypothetical protein ACREUC_07660 [Steroidobacteraceae bacterium]